MMNFQSNQLFVALLTLGLWAGEAVAQEKLLIFYPDPANGSQEQGRDGDAQKRCQPASSEAEKSRYQEFTRTLMLINLAGIYAAQGKYGQAELLYEQWLAKMQSAPGLQYPDTLTILNNLASLYVAQGKYGQAELLYRQWLAGMEKVAKEREKAEKPSPSDTIERPLQ